MNSKQPLSRRTFLQRSALASVALGLVACGQTAPTTGDDAATASAAAEGASTAASAATGAASAAPQSAAAAPAGAPVNLVFVCDTINEGHQKIRDQWVAAFNESHPGVTVEHQPVPNQDYSTKLQTLFASGTAPDLFRYLQELTPIITVAEKSLHLPLDEYVATANYDLSDFRPSAVELYRWDGKLYALPRDYGNQNIYYNADLFAQAGIEAPPADWEETTWTFDAFLEAAKALTVKNGDRTEQWGFIVNRGLRPWSSWVYNNGGALVNKDDKGVATDMSLDQPNAVEALQFLQDLMYTHGVAPRPELESETGGFELFASGKVGMSLTNPSDVTRYRTIESFKWDVATLPLGKTEKRGTGGGGTGWAIAAASKAPEQAWEFLASITSAEAQTDEVSVGATTPSRVSVVTSTAFIDPNKPPAHAAAFAQAQEYVVRDPVNVRWAEIVQRAVNPNMDQLWNGTKPAADVVAAIKAAADPLLKG